MDHAVEHNHEHSPNGSSGHEHREVSPSLIIYSAIGLSITVGVVLLLIWGVFNVLKNAEASKGQELSHLGPAVQIPPEPRLEEHPYESMQQLRAHEEQVLNGYAWQDQKAGIVRIPIDRAIEIVAERGFPAAQPVAKPKAGAKNARP